MMATFVPTVYANPGSGAGVEGGANPGSSGSDNPSGNTPRRDDVYDNKVRRIVIAQPGCTHNLIYTNYASQYWPKSDSNPPNPDNCHRYVSNRTNYNGDMDTNWFALSGTGWSYDVQSRTLTLDNYNSGAIYVDISPTSEESTINFNIRLNGENTISTNIDNDYSLGFWYGLHVSSGNLNISGSGSLTINANRGIAVNMYGSNEETGILRVSNGASLNIKGKWAGIDCSGLSIDSKCVVAASVTETSPPASFPTERLNAVAATHVRCNGTLIGITGNPAWHGFGGSMYNIGSNVVAYTGTNAANASAANPFTAHTIQRYGGNTLYWDHEKRTPYMALVEGGMTYTPVTAVYLPAASSDSPATPPTTPPPAQEIKVLVNGTALTFDQPPIIENGRTLVPLRAIFEALGATVDWSQSAQTVTAVKDDVTIVLKIGDAFLTKNGARIALDVPGKLVGGRTLVPARAIAESFGASVGWDQATRTVTITE